MGLTPLGIGMGLAGTALQMYNAYNQNREIKKKMGMMKAPTDEGVNLAKGTLAEIQAKEIMPGMAQAQRDIASSQGTTQSNIERSSVDPTSAILGAGAVQGMTNKAYQDLSKEQAQYAQNRLQMKAQATQAVQQAIAQRDAAYNDYLQSLISGSSSMGQNVSSIGTSLSNFGGGLLSNAAYTQGLQSNWKFDPATGKPIIK
jgi:hypothetical protein